MRGEQSPQDPSITHAIAQTDSERDIAFFEEHRHVLSAFTRGRFEVRPPRPEHKTFCVDLEPLSRGEMAIVYGSPRFYEKTGESEAKAFNSFLHELNHIEEVVELLNEENGEALWTADVRHRAKSRRLHMLDNLQDDVRMDRGIEKKAPNQEDLSQKMYREDLYPSDDFSRHPRHVQFMYACFYENRVGEAIVSPDVRAEIDMLKAVVTRSGRTMWDVQGDTAIAPSVRIGLRKKYLEPAMERLYALDVEEQKEQRAKNKEQDSNVGQTENEDQKNSDGQSTSLGDLPKGETSGEVGEGAFAASYDEFDAKNPDAMLDMKQLAGEIGKYAKDMPVGKLVKETGVSLKDQNDLEKFKQAMEAFALANKTSKQALLKPGVERDDFKDGLNKALDAGVNPADYFAYHAEKETLEGIKNPETGETVMSELREVFERIITERLQKRRRPRHPLKEGVFLKDPATAYVESKYLGTREPEVWSDYRNKHETHQQCGSIDIVLLADRSASMKGEKASEQRKAILVLLEAIKEFIDDIAVERSYGNIDEDDDLGVRIGVRSFGGRAENEEIKPLSGELTEQDRISAFRKLQDTAGRLTQDFLAVKAVFDSLSDEDKQTLAEKKRRMLVLSLTDGASDDEVVLQTEIQKLRDIGVMVVGIGITTSGGAAKTAYAPHGDVCEDVSLLAVKLGDVLKEFLGEV